MDGPLETRVNGPDADQGRAILVSVIVPTFNRAPMLTDLSSIAAQTYPNIEIVVVDDGSTDDSADVVARWAQRSSHSIRYHRQSNQGCASARNRGLQISTGEFFSFLDSDDEWTPNAAEVLAGELRRSGADFAYSPSVEVLPRKLPRREVLNYPLGRPESFAVEHFMGSGIRIGSFMCRREVLAGVGGMDEELRHNEDSDFVQRMAILYRGAYCDTPTVWVHHHAANKSGNRVAIHRALLQSANNVLRDHPVFATELGKRGDQQKQELERQYIDALILAREWGVAEDEVAELKTDLSAVTRIAFAMRSTRPIRIREGFRLWKRRRSSSFGNESAVLARRVPNQIFQKR